MPPRVEIAKFRNALTIDVEDWFQVAAFFPYIRESQWNDLESRVIANTEKILDLLYAHRTRATFFVLGWIAERYPELIRRISAAGHEIACHGYSHRLVYTQSQEQFTEETRRAKFIIEDAIGGAVNGYRASTYSITAKSLWALDVLLEQGFSYDSSIFPTRHPQYGIRGADRFPSVITTPGGGRIIEFPLSTARFIGLNLPVAGGGYFRQLPYAYTRLGLASINQREGEPFIFYLHPWELDPGQPRIDAARWLTRLRHYRNLALTESRLRALLRDFSFTSVAQVLADRQLLPAVPAGVA